MKMSVRRNVKGHFQKMTNDSEIRRFSQVVRICESQIHKYQVSTEDMILSNGEDNKSKKSCIHFGVQIQRSRSQGDTR